VSDRALALDFVDSRAMTRSIRSVLKGGLNRIVEPFGVRLVSATQEDYYRQKLPSVLSELATAKERYNRSHAEFKYLLEKHRVLISEVHGFFHEFIFPDFPPQEQRIKLMAELTGTQVSEAIYLCNYLRQVLPLEGDVCEFGVAHGTTSVLIANEIRDSGKNLWLFDSFKGLPQPTEKDVLIDDIYGLGSMDKYEGTMSGSVDQVLTRLAGVGFPPERTKIVPGYVEDTLQGSHLPECVCFAYVDMDFYAPIRLALDFLQTRLSSHGIVMVDDYGFFSAGAKSAVDEFVEAHPNGYYVITPYEFAGHYVLFQKI
jgi:hypothetical protein